MIKLFRVNVDVSAAGEVAAILKSGWIAQGPAVERFERWLASQVGGQVLTVNSGTAALELAYELASVRNGHVIVTPMTCAATTLPLLQRNVEIEWADVDPMTGLIDPQDVASKLTQHTRAVVGVDWGGSYFDAAPFATQLTTDQAIIADSAHCLPDIGSIHRDYVTWSFQAIKFLTTGDGGALLVPEDKFALAKKLRWFGFDRESKEDFRSAQKLEIAGYKWHMNDIAAAIGMANREIALRARAAAKDNAFYYHNRFMALPGLVRPPLESDCWLYTILVPERDEFVTFMKRRGIEVSQVHTRNDLHPVFARRYGTPSLPGLNHFSAHQVSIPVGMHVTVEDREVIANAVEDWCERYRQ